jgi:hypothetical protein
MWNQTPAAGAARSSVRPPAFALKPVAWSDAQIDRLKREFQGVLRAFAYHPFVSVAAQRGDPPAVYRVDFRVRSVVLDAAQQLSYVDAVAVEIWLPPGYPADAPLVRPLAAVFHPNVSYEAVHFAEPRQSADSLAEIIGRVGEYLSFRGYDPSVVVNEMALQWARDNAGLLPLDARADFSPLAGGEPLERIGRFGAATLEQMGRSVDEVLAVLSGEGPGPTIEQVRAFAHQTRVAMSLFLAEDVPAALRAGAAKFDHAALDLPASVPLWQHVRRLVSWKKSMMAQSGELAATRAQLEGELEKLSAMLRTNFADAADASRQIPSAAALQEILLRLPSVYKDVGNRAEALRALIGAAAPVRPANPLRQEGIVARPLLARLKETEDDVEFARHRAAEALAAMDRLLPRARGDVIALRVIGGWREYIDTFAKAVALEKNLADLGGDGIEAYTISVGDDRFGPFQLEQEVALGELRVAVTSKQPGAIEVCDVANETILGRGTGGSAVAMLPGETGGPRAMTFALSEGCDELLLRLEYALRHTGGLLPKLQSITGDIGESWCGRMLALFAAEEAQQGARSEQRRAAHRWESLIEDLKALSSFKTRLATCFMLMRSEESVGRLLPQRAAHRSDIQAATGRIRAIAERSSRDAEGQLIMSPKNAREFAEQTDALEVAKKGLERAASRLEKLSNRLRERLASPRCCGRPQTPALRRIGAISAELSGRAAGFSDEWLRAVAARLAAQLKTTFMVNIPEAPEPKVPKAPPPADSVVPATIEPPLLSEEAERDLVAAGHDEPMAEAMPGEVTEERVAGEIVAPETVARETEPAEEPFVIDVDEEFAVEEDVILEDEGE